MTAQSLITNSEVKSCEGLKAHTDYFTNTSTPSLEGSSRLSHITSGAHYFPSTCNQVGVMSEIVTPRLAFDRDGFVKLLRLQSAHGESYLHLTAKLRSEDRLYELLTSVTVGECGELLFYTLLNKVEDDEGKTVVDRAVESGVGHKIVEFIHDCAQGILLSAVQDLSLDECLVEYDDDRVSKFFTFFELIVNNSNSEELLLILLTTDNHDRTILHHAVLLNSGSLIDLVSKSGMSSSQKLELYLKQDFLGYSMAHCAILTNASNYMTVLTAAIECLEVEDKLKLLSLRNGVNQTIFHVECEKQQSTPFIKHLIDDFSHNSDFYELFYIYNAAGLTVFHQLALKRCTDLLERIVTNISQERVEQLLTLPIKNGGETVLHILARRNLIDSISRMLVVFPDSMDRIKLLLLPDTDQGFTPFHYLVSNAISDWCKGLSSLSGLLLLVRPSLVHKLLQSTTRKGYTVLHFAADSCSTNLLKVMLLPVSEYLLELLTISDCDGDTPLMSAIKSRRTIIAHYLLNIVDFEQRKELVRVKDNNGRDALYWAKEEGNTSVYQRMLEITNTYLENPLTIELEDKAKGAESNEEDIFPSYIRHILNAGLVVIAHANPERLEQVYQMTKPALTIQYTKVSTRLSSFEDYPSSCMPRLPLAVAGFIFFKDTKEDEVLCVWCHLQLYNFVEYVNAMAIHKAYSDNICQFLQNMSQWNANEITDGIAERHMKITAKMDHVKMDHAKMDHAKMDHVADEGYVTSNFQTHSSITGTLSTTSLASGSSTSNSSTSGYATDFCTSKLRVESSPIAMDETDRGATAATDRGAAASATSINTTNDILTMAAQSTDPTLANVSSASDGDIIPVDDAEVMKRYVKFCQPSYSIDDKLWNAMQPRSSYGNSFAYESTRLHTFLNRSWKRQVAEDFAVAGFFLYSSDNSQVMCAFCNNKLRITEEDIALCSPLELHRKKFPSCSFINGQKLETRGRSVASIVNVPQLNSERVWSASFKQPQKQAAMAEFEGLGIQTTQVLCPALGVLDRRRDTYRTFPNGHPKDVEKLAEAGYYFEGKGTSVTCFACAVVSDHWTASEDVWKRHARSSGSCPYMLLSKGAEFVRASIEELGVYRTPEEENKLTQVANRMLRPRMDSIVVQQVLDMGYERNLVRTAVINRLKKLAPDYTKIADLVKDVLAMKMPDMQSIVGSSQSVLPERASPPTAADSRVVEIYIQSESTDNVTTDSLATEPEQKIDADLNTVSDQSALQIISQLTCKVCISALINIIFLPCGHFVCCTSCSAAMTHCPICRQEIRGTIKAHFT